MHSVPTTLSQEQIRHFQDHGYVVAKGAFAPEDALAMQHEWWLELAEVYGIARDDRSTWRQPRADLKRAKSSAIQQRLATPRVRGVIDDLLGAGAWPPPRHWGRVLTTFPQPGAWDVPTKTWHSDNLCAWHRDAMNGLLVFSFVGSVESGSGGTLILSGSPRLLLRHDAALQRSGEPHNPYGVRDLNDRFHRSHPWLAALAGAAVSPVDRIAFFMEAGTEIDGVPVRVVELTGEPGDMVFCHPVMLHSASPNHGTQPRFMRIAGVLTHAGLRRRSGRVAPE
jgi:hypothetical protein